MTCLSRGISILHTTRLTPTSLNLRFAESRPDSPTIVLEGSSSPEDWTVWEIAGKFGPAISIGKSGRPTESCPRWAVRPGRLSGVF